MHRAQAFRLINTPAAEVQPAPSPSGPFALLNGELVTAIVAHLLVLEKRKGDALRTEVKATLRDVAGLMLSCQLMHQWVVCSAPYLAECACRAATDLQPRDMSTAVPYVNQLRQELSSSATAAFAIRVLPARASHLHSEHCELPRHYFNQLPESEGRLRVASKSCRDLVCSAASETAFVFEVTTQPRSGALPLVHRELLRCDASPHARNATRLPQYDVLGHTSTPVAFNVVKMAASPCGNWLLALVQDPDQTQLDPLNPFPRPVRRLVLWTPTPPPTPYVNWNSPRS